MDAKLHICGQKAKKNDWKKELLLKKCTSVIKKTFTKDFCLLFSFLATAKFHRPVLLKRLNDNTKNTCTTCTWRFFASNKKLYLHAPWGASGHSPLWLYMHLWKSASFFEKVNDFFKKTVDFFVKSGHRRTPHKTDDMPIEMIAKYTGLSIQTIKQI